MSRVFSRFFSPAIVIRRDIVHVTPLMQVCAGPVELSLPIGTVPE